MKKVILTISLIITILFANTSLAINLDKALLYNDHYTKEYLYFNNGNTLKAAVVMYNNNGETYPAYCIESTKDGIGELDSYEVQFKNTMTDDGIWRIVTNGYPYKTPAQMGLNNADEAYFATKHAIYRYLANGTVDYYAGGINEEGERVYNAIAALLNIGYNGNTKYGEAEVEVKKVGQIQIQEEYFVQECQVDVNVNYKNIKIASDYQISDLNGDKFYIYIPKETTNPTVTLNIEFEAETKPLLYGEAYNEEYQDYVITGDSYEEFTKTVLLELETPVLYDIEIIKTDNNQNLLPNAKFEVRNESGEVVGTVITDEKGSAIIKNLEIGIYEIEEIEAPEGYELNTALKIVDLNENKKVTVYNKKIEIIEEIPPVEDNTVIPEILVDIEKTGAKKVEPGGEISYLFQKIENKSNVELDNLIWLEELPKEVTIYKMYTGTYNEDLVYNVYCYSNNEWKLYKENLSTQVNNELVFEEKIEKIKVEFGKVGVEFKKVESPRITGIVDEDLKNVNIIINNTSLTGLYKELESTDKDDHITQVYTEPKIPERVEPEVEIPEPELPDEPEPPKPVVPNMPEYVEPIIPDIVVPEILVDIEKSGTKEIEPGSTIEYVFPKLENNSNVELDNLIWIEELPKAVTISKMYTGTYNQDTTYNLYCYINNEWKLYKENLSTQINNELVFNEKVEKIRVEFGKVNIGFKANESPMIIGDVNDTLRSGNTIINNTILTGIYKEVENTDKATHETIVYIKEKPPVTLPKTGR